MTKFIATSSKHPTVTTSDATTTFHATTFFNILQFSFPFAHPTMDYASIETPAACYADFCLIPVCFASFFFSLPATIFLQRLNPCPRKKGLKGPCMHREEGGKKLTLVVSFLLFARSAQETFPSPKRSPTFSASSRPAGSSTRCTLQAPPSVWANARTLSH